MTSTLMELAAQWDAQADIAQAKSDAYDDGAILDPVTAAKVSAYEACVKLSRLHANQLRTAAAEGVEAVAVVIPNVVGVEIAWANPPSHGRPPVGTKLYLHPSTDSGAGRESAFVAEWGRRFGFLASRYDPSSIESIDEVACYLNNAGRDGSSMFDGTRYLTTDGFELRFHINVGINTWKEGEWCSFYEASLTDAYEALRLCGASRIEDTAIAGAAGEKGCG